MSRCEEEKRKRKWEEEEEEEEGVEGVWSLSVDHSWSPTMTLDTVTTANGTNFHVVTFHILCFDHTHPPSLTLPSSPRNLASTSYSCQHNHINQAWESAEQTVRRPATTPLTTRRRT
jgi:hypothetical protein